MTEQDLQALLDDHLQNDKNYQHAGKSWEEIDALALKSFNRIPADHKKTVMSVCVNFGFKDVTLILRARFMAQTNLFFLCRLLGYHKVSRKEYVWTDNQVHNTHEEICNDFFVRKDPTVKTFEQFGLTYIDRHKRLLLVPRGGFKSTIDMADCVQWVLCYPEVTILILTGVLELAKDFVGEIKQHFTLEETADMGYKLLYKPSTKQRTYKPRKLHAEDSVFQVLFPEHCVAPEDGKEYEYQTPASSVIQKESTVFAASIEQNLVGWHVGVMKLDDVVTNENSNTLDRMQKINKQVSINAAMLHPYGFYDKIGTWYDAADTYGVDIKNSIKAKESGDEFPIKIYIRAAWWPTEEAKKQGLIPEEMKEKDYCYWFNEPGQLDYKFLNENKNDEYFAIKYLNDPTQLHSIKFPRELLIRRTIPANLIPPGQGMFVTCVDTAYSTKLGADYTVIITALIFGGRFYIIDMKRGRYNEYELPALIAATAFQWKPRRVCIEDSIGVKWLGREIYREMDKLKVRTFIEFVSLGQGNKAKNSKTAKARPVLRFIGDERLLFANSCPSLEELYDELGKFGTAACQHDDIVSALSILVMQFAGYADMEAAQSFQGSNSFLGDAQMKEHADQAFCDGKYLKLNALQQQLMQMENPNVPLQEQVKQDHQSYLEANYDPLKDLFG